MKMDALYSRIAANGQPDRRGVETCRAVRIGMPERNTDRMFSFQFENVALQFVAITRVESTCPGKPWFPIIQPQEQTPAFA